ncbi:potassium channel family protein [Roseovarius arcticus]|uniref:potassium channel family protein n=1 Tax=Roseovarius arcticus TaxID=2547404 RepID=UPI0011104F49|nr:potassium channel family protein [Roseovarius arcticus]
MEKLKKKVNLLYTGTSKKAAMFRYLLMGFDVSTIVFFIATVPREPTPAILAADLVIGTLILTDFLSRLWIAPNRARMMRQIYTVTDVVVILSLLLAPLVSQSFGFLRVLRTLRLLHSYHVLRDLRRDTPFFRRNEDVIVSSVNLCVFIFFMSTLVFVLRVDYNPDIVGYVDALYFTVSTLTTTGFGDIVLTGTTGRLVAVVIMVAGVALFLRLAQTVFQPSKLHHMCPECALNRHDTDAVHCKHCGHLLKIETGGAS